MKKNTRFYDQHEEFTDIAYNSDKDILPDRYVFILTNLCNLNCDFCFQDKVPKKNAMTFEDWVNVTKQLPEYARVTLTGGEPLIFKSFMKVFKNVAEKFDCNIITNGLLLDEEKINYFLDFPRFKILSLSIDDIGGRIRGVNSKQWNHLTEMAKYFVDLKNIKNPDCTLDVKTTILDRNVENLFKIYKYMVEEIGANTHSFQFLKGSPIQHSDRMFSLQDITQKSQAYEYKKFGTILKQLELIREYNLRNKKNSYLHPKICSLTGEKPIENIDYINNTDHINELHKPCKFPWSSVHINYDGNLFPCLAVSMGDVKEKTLDEIIKGGKFRKFRSLIKKNGTVEACNRCGWLRPK